MEKEPKNGDLKPIKDTLKNKLAFLSLVCGIIAVMPIILFFIGFIGKVSEFKIFSDYIIDILIESFGIFFPLAIISIPLGLISGMIGQSQGKFFTKIGIMLALIGLLGLVFNLPYTLDAIDVSIWKANCVLLKDGCSTYRNSDKYCEMDGDCITRKNSCGVINKYHYNAFKVAMEHIFFIGCGWQISVVKCCQNSCQPNSCLIPVYP